jgi:quinol monooxygenase YgiN
VNVRRKDLSERSSIRPCRPAGAGEGGLADHIALTRAEPGCLSFEVLEDANIPGQFNVSEAFVDQAAFDAHQARTETSAWFMVTQGIPQDYSITSG